MASSQNSKEATRWPVTWEHRHIYISPKQMGKGGGKEADSCQNFGAFQNVFLLLLPLSLCLSRRWYIYPLAPSKPPHTPPFILFPSAATETTNMMALREWRQGGLLADHLLGTSRACSAVFQHSFLACYLGLGLRSEARGG